jgi:peptidoglycan/LPS O-acetylase OafA/YrhL
MAKQHYAGLDGLRGVAALAVVLFHFAGDCGLKGLVPRGYLAVDFFFGLSGFVIAAAYARRLGEGLGLKRFAAIRVRRLWPMLILGDLLGALAAVLTWSVTGSPDPRIIAVAALAGLFCVPTTLDRSAFPFNAPAWSIVYEMAVNLLWAAWAPRLTTRALAMAVGVSGLALGAALALHGGADGGSSLADWDLAAARTLFDFGLGLLIFRLRPRLPLPLPVSGIVLAGLLLVPARLGWGPDALAIFLVFPVLVVAGSTAAGGPLACFAGRMSYPLYALHYPLIAVFRYLMRGQVLSHAMAPGLVLLELATAIGLAWLALRFIDDPIRLRMNAHPTVSSAPFPVEAAGPP